jgi:hypothetical protein
LDWGNLHQDYGFIAQELEPTLSGIVTKGKTDEDMWQLDYAKLTPHLDKSHPRTQSPCRHTSHRDCTTENKGGINGNKYDWCKQPSTVKDSDCCPTASGCGVAGGARYIRNTSYN